MINKFKIEKITIEDNNLPISIAEIEIDHNDYMEFEINVSNNTIKVEVKFIKHRRQIIEYDMSEDSKKAILGDSSLSIYEIKKCASQEKNETKINTVNC